MKTSENEEEFKNLYGPYFSYLEMACKCAECKHARTNSVAMGGWFRTPEFKAFMLKLVNLRVECGFPFPVNSGYRCPKYNDSLYSGDGTHLDGPHTKGAADIGVTFERAYKLNKAASARDMGIGPTQHGPKGKRFMHLDNQGPRLWTYG